MIVTEINKEALQRKN